jgi:hypothetical protein
MNRKTTPKFTAIVAVLTLGAALTFCSAPARAGVIGPVLPYFGIAQSPFNGLLLPFGDV